MTQIGVNFSSLRVNVEEIRQVNEQPEQYVRRLALEKARAGWRLLQCKQYPPRPVLGADTIGLLDGQVLEKPRDLEHFLHIMQMLSGQTHHIVTAVAMIDDANERLSHSVTKVTFRCLSDAEITRYWQTGEPQDKACGYGIQGLGAVFVASISGSYTGVVGLPVETTIELLRHFKVSWWCNSQHEKQSESKA